jgi:hypothetical protein
MMMKLTEDVDKKKNGMIYLISSKQLIKMWFFSVENVKIGKFSLSQRKASFLVEIFAERKHRNLSSLTHILFLISSCRQIIIIHTFMHKKGKKKKTEKY